MRSPSSPLTIVLSLLVTTTGNAGAQSYIRDLVDGGRAGFAAALVMDGDALYAGRPGELAYFPTPPNHAGTVHEFTRASDGTWIERDTIATPSVTVGDAFGAALDVAGNLMVVGAPKQNETRGTAYVFTREHAGARWTESAALSAPEPAVGDLFGNSVAIVGDAVLVGAPGRANGTGTVVVFRRSDGGWSQASVLAPTGAAEGDAVGHALSGDGSRVLIGGPGVLPRLFGGAQTRAGQAWIFTVDANGTWREEARLSTGGLEPAALGAGVLLVADEAFVAAPVANQSAGSVVRFRRSSGGQWTEAGRLNATRPSPGAGFGMSLALAGSDLLVGAPNLNGTGGVFVFRPDSLRTWSAVQVISEAPQFAFLGTALAAREDLAVLGAPGADFFEGAGLVYRKDAASSEWRRVGNVTTDVVALEPITGSEVRCEGGKARDFGCADVDLLSFLPVSAIGGKRGIIVNDLWGWTDPETNREYAIVGRADGTTFIDVTDPSNPVYLGELPMRQGAVANLWRDMKVVNDHAFIVADGAGNHGMQVFDLTQLRNVKNAPVTFKETAHYGRVHSAHNIVANPETGFVYIVGGSMGGETCGGGLHMVDVRDPKKPQFAGCFADPRTGQARTGYSHDAQCITYKGPDEQYRGREICFGANESALSIADVTDKKKPVPISTAAYPNVAYLHQGWVSDDHRYLYMNDEGDELAGTVPRTRTLVWDISDLDDPILVKEYLGETAASDHNLYVRGNYLYASNYVSGLRIIDISDPVNPKEVGHFDTVPWGDDVPGFAGSWSNYPYFRSGIIVVTSMREGVFILRYRGSRPVS